LRSIRVVGSIREISYLSYLIVITVHRAFVSGCEG
jgi:hypothetical protein